MAVRSSTCSRRYGSYRAAAEKDVPAADIAHGYRWTSLIDTGEIVSASGSRCGRGAGEIALGLGSRGERRGALLGANAGSIFKNPPGDYAGSRLIEACGLKGEARRRGHLAAARQRIVNGTARAPADVLEHDAPDARRVVESSA